MKILLLTKYDQSGASSRYRTLQFLSYLKKDGAEFMISSLLDSTYVEAIYNKKKPPRFYAVKRFLKRIYDIKIKFRNNDLVWLEGELFPYLPYFFEKLFLPKNYVAEYDDAIFHNYDTHRIWLVRKLLSKKIKKIMRHSKHVIVGNAYVKEYAESAGASQISVIPTVVDAEKYRKHESTEKSDDHQVVVGWLGSPTTVKNIPKIESILINASKMADIKFLIIGGAYQTDKINMECFHWPSKWSESEEIQYLNKIDIGIMPIDDTPWERGKCGFKLIKYMACSKPVIASPVSINNEIVSDGVNGYLANSPEEWEQAIVRLARDPGMRDRFGKAGREKMVNFYSTQSAAPIIKKILFDAIKTG